MVQGNLYWDQEGLLDGEEKNLDNSCHNPFKGTMREIFEVEFF